MTRTRLPRPVRLADEGLCAPISRRRPPGKPDPWLSDTGEAAAAAKLICARCPVRVECLDYAVAARETAGVWGGLTTSERAPLVREQTRAAHETLMRERAEFDRVVLVLSRQGLTSRGIAAIGHVDPDRVMRAVGRLTRAGYRLGTTS